MMTTYNIIAMIVAITIPLSLLLLLWFITTGMEKESRLNRERNDEINIASRIRN